MVIRIIWICYYSIISCINTIYILCWPCRINFFCVNIINIKTIIVIGAGISGLSAAKNLKIKGYNVTVLEAKDYIGGRIKTQNFNGIKLECFNKSFE